MRPTMLSGATLAVLLAATAPGHAADDMKAAIDQQIAAFEDAYNNGDAAAMGELYTEDAAILPPGAARMDGRQAISEIWGGAMEQGLAELDLSTVELETAGDDMATEIGTFTATAPAAEGGGASDVAGKYLVVWKRGDDGTWRLHRDIWNMGQ